MSQQLAAQRVLDLFNTGTFGFFICGIQPNGNTSVCVWNWQFGGCCDRGCGPEQPIHRHCFPASDVDISVCDGRRGEFYRHSRPVAGLDPARGDYASFANFSDPDGNSWVLQERGYCNV